jgi:hypothetical protein
MRPDARGQGATSRSLEEQRSELAGRRLTAMPIAGVIAWTVVGIGGVTLGPTGAVWTLFIATGSIASLGLLVSRFTGERLYDRSRPKNVFDALFFHGVAQALLVFAIAIPFFRVDYTSLPLTVGILTGLMWMPLSWIIEHWVGVFHATARTMLVVTAWYAFPEARFLAVPSVIVAVYLITIVVLEARWRRIEALNPRR